MALGLEAYFTGRPCKHGHIAPRNTMRRQCRTCETMNSNGWKRANRSYCAAGRAKYRAAQLKRTPPWADLDAIQSIFTWCPTGYHVDHVIPLQGKLVSGLHVPNNLRCIPARDNASKGARFDPEENYHL